MTIEQLCKKIAAAEGMTPEEVQKEMQDALEEILKNPKIRHKILCKGEKPTLEEFLNYAVKKL